MAITQVRGPFPHIENIPSPGPACTKKPDFFIMEPINKRHFQAAKEEAMVEISKVCDLVRSLRPLFMDASLAHQVTVKGRADYVTAVDTAVQERVRRFLSAQWPDIQFLAEEKDNSDIDLVGSVWILDPVDGTTNLMYGERFSALSLALARGGRLELGLIYQPWADELFWAQRGQGAWLNQTPIRVRQAPDLARSLIAVGTSPYQKELAEENFDLFRRVFQACRDIRRAGSAALDLAYVACGRLDGFIERQLKPWDVAAGILLVEEAGGCVTDYDGKPVDFTGKCDISAACPATHRGLLELTKTMKKD